MPLLEVEKRGKKDNKIIKKTYTIDTETGEIQKQETNFFDKFFSDKRGYQFRHNSSRHLKIFRRDSLPVELSLKEIGMFYKMVMFLEGENQLLAYWNGHGLQPLTMEKMCESFECTERQVKIFLNKLIKNHIIKEVKMWERTWYAVNPKYVMKGKFLTQFVFYWFKDELKDEVPKSVQDRWI